MTGAAHDSGVPGAVGHDAGSPWESREALEEAVATYQRTWWRHDVAALDVINNSVDHPGLRAQVRTSASLGERVTTADVYRPQHHNAEENRPYLPARVAVHERIINDCVPTQQGRRIGVGERESEAVSRPAAFFTIGCPGAGKTSVLRNLVERYRTRRAGGPPEAASLIDADRVRQLLPEYAGGLGAFVVEPECYDVTYGPLFDRAVERNADLIYDTIGRLVWVRAYADSLAERGFDIHVLRADCPLPVCEERARRRALEVDGRLVSSAVTAGAARDAVETLGALRNENYPLAGWAVVDTAGDVPTLVEGTAPWTDLLTTGTSD